MPSRRSFGSIDHLASGRWRVRYRDADGRRHTAGPFGAKSDASRFLAIVEADLLRGDWRDPSLVAVHFEEWAAEWGKTIVHLAPKTQAEYASNLKSHVLPFFADEPIGAIDRSAVRGFLSAMRAKGLAPATIKKAWIVLRLVLAVAVDAGALKANPCDGVKLGRIRRQEAVFLTAAQVEDVAQAITTPYGVLVRFAAYTGLRAGEIAALRVGRLDLLRRRVEVAESLAEVGGRGLVFGPTKNYQRRAVPLPASIASELAEHLAGRGRPARDELVFTAPQGGALRHHHFYERHFKPAVAAAGLPSGTRFHDLRHSCAALLIAQGAHQLTIMRRLGHSSITVTLDTYGHLFPELEEDLTDRLDAVARAAACGRPRRAAAEKR
jgi:integrase